MCKNFDKIAGEKKKIYNENEMEFLKESTKKAIFFWDVRIDLRRGKKSK